MSLDKESTCLLQCMREAGDRAHQIQDSARSELKKDGTPVSEADTLANTIIVDALQKYFPDDSILSEEMTDDLSRLSADRVWIIDPIDGTSAFLEGRDEWAVQVALAVNNTLVLGALYLPAKNRFYIGVIGVGARLYASDDSFVPCRIPADPTLCILLSRSKRNQNAMMHIQEILPEFSTVIVSSIGAKVDALMQGVGCFHLNPAEIYEWDYAAPAAVLIAAGGYCCDQNNKMLPINSRRGTCDGLVLSSFTNKSQHDNIVDRLHDV